MIKREKKFCERCGKPLTERQTPRYNAYTGLPIVEKVCLTYKCPHNDICTYSQHTVKFFTDTCTRCGLNCTLGTI